MDTHNSYNINIYIFIGIARRDAQQFKNAHRTVGGEPYGLCFHGVASALPSKCLSDCVCGGGDRNAVESVCGFKLSPSDTPSPNYLMQTRTHSAEYSMTGVHVHRPERE